MPKIFKYKNRYKVSRNSARYAIFRNAKKKRKQILREENLTRFLAGNFTAKEQRKLDKVFLCRPNPGAINIEPLQGNLANCQSPALGMIFGYLLLGAKGLPFLSFTINFARLLWHSVTAPATCSTPTWGAYATEIPTFPDQASAVVQCQPPRCTLEELLALDNREHFFTADINWPPKESFIIFERSGVIGDTENVPFDIIQANTDFFTLCDANLADDHQQAQFFFQKIFKKIPQNDTRFNYLFHQMYTQAILINIQITKFTTNIKFFFEAKMCCEIAAGLYAATPFIIDKYKYLTSQIEMDFEIEKIKKLPTLASITESTMPTLAPIVKDTKHIIELSRTKDFPPVHHLQLMIFYDTESKSLRGDLTGLSFDIAEASRGYSRLVTAFENKDFYVAYELFHRILRGMPKNNPRLNPFLHQLFTAYAMTTKKLYHQTGNREYLSKSRTAAETAVELFGMSPSLEKVYDTVLELIAKIELGSNQEPQDQNKCSSENSEQKIKIPKIIYIEKRGWWPWIIKCITAVSALFGGGIWFKKIVAEKEKRKLYQEEILVKLNNFTQNFFTSQWESIGNNTFILDISLPNTRTTVNIDGQHITITHCTLREQLQNACQLPFGDADLKMQETTLIITIPVNFKKSFHPLVKRIEKALWESSPEYYAAREREAQLAQEHADNHCIADKKQRIAALKEELSSTAYKIKCNILLFRNMFETAQKDANQHKSNPDPKIHQLTRQITALAAKIKESGVVVSLGKKYEQLKLFQAGKEEEAKIDSSEDELDAEIAHLQALKYAVTDDLTIIAQNKTELKSLLLALEQQLATQAEQQRLEQEREIQRLTAEIETIKAELDRANTKLEAQLQVFLVTAEDNLAAAQLHIFSPDPNIANAATELATPCHVIKSLAQEIQVHPALQEHQRLDDLWKHFRPITEEGLTSTLAEWQACFASSQGRFHDFWLSQEKLLKEEYNKLPEKKGELNQTISQQAILLPSDPLPQKHIIPQSAGHTKKKTGQQKKQKVNRIPNSNSFWHNRKSSQEYIDELLQLAHWMSLLNSMNQAQERNLFGLEPFKVPFEIGNCLFEAIAAFFPGNDGADMRSLAVTYIQQNQQLRDRITALAGYPNTTIRTARGNMIYNDVEEYLEIMRQNRTWGTEIELVALARALECPIVVLTPGNEYDQIIPGEGENYNSYNTIFLNYYSGEHYAPLAVPEGQNHRAILAQIQKSIQFRHHTERAKAANSSNQKLVP